MTKCYICNRRSHKTSNLSFHRFPADEELKQKWLKIIGKNDPPPVKGSTVCSLHFMEDCFRYGLVYGMRRIKEDAIPSLYFQESLEETEMLNKLHKSSVNQTLDEVINNCQIGDSEEAVLTNAGENPARAIYKRKRSLKSRDSTKLKKYELTPKRVKLNLTWEKITSAPGGGKRYWESAQQELAKRKTKIERLQLTLKQTRLKLRKVKTVIKDLKKNLVQDENSRKLVSNLKVETNY